MNMEEFTFERMLLRWFRFYRDNLLTIAIFMCVGAVGSYIRIVSKENVYKTDCLVYSNLISSNNLGTILQDLETFVEKGNYTRLSEALNISAGEVSQVKSIEVVYQPSPLSDGREEIFNDFSSNCILIELKVADPGIIPKFQAGLSNYIDHNGFLVQLSEIRIRSIRKIIAKIDEQIKALEEFQKSSISTMKAENDGLIFAGDYSNTSSVNLLSLLEKKANYDEMLAMKSAEFIKPFYIPEKPQTQLLIYISAGIMLGFILGVAFSILRKLNRKA